MEFILITYVRWLRTRGVVKGVPLIWERLKNWKIEGIQLRAWTYSFRIELILAFLGTILTHRQNSRTRGTIKIRGLRSRLPLTLPQMQTSSQIQLGRYKGLGLLPYCIRFLRLHRRFPCRVMIQTEREENQMAYHL